MLTRGWLSSCRVTSRGKAVAVDGERASGRELVPIGGGQDQRAGAAHLLMQQADGVGRPIVGAERVGADELGEGVGLMRLGPPLGAHLVEHHGHAGRGELPSGLAAGEPAADDMNLRHHDR